MSSPLVKTFIWLTLFCVAMGFLETAVVVYLRKLYYPDGFAFPLVPIGDEIVITEIWREVATLIMLLGVAMLAGKNAVQRFAFFLFAFAVWDIFYYVFLYVLLGWPQSLFTWDVLFLIPIPWVGPVISPLILTILMLIHACLMVFFDNKGTNARVIPREWVMLIAGSVVVILSWTWDYFKYMTSINPDESIWSLSSREALLETTKSYVPESFNWLLFIVGTFVILFAIVTYYVRNRKQLSVR